MKVFVTGGAGFVGRSVVQALLTGGHQVHALVNRRAIDQAGVTSFTGGLFNDAALDAGMRDCQAVIHLVGIIAEKPTRGITFDRIHYQGTQQVVNAARRGGINRYVQMSALGASPDSPAHYHRSKFAAQACVMASGLGWTIIQPSLIHGPGGDFSKMERGWARATAAPFFFMPYFGSGLSGTGKPYHIQPVFVQEVAAAFTQCLENPRTIDEVLQIGGSQQLTWPQMHRIAAQIIAGRNRLILPIPAWYARAITRMIPLLPFTRDQVWMSQQDNICDLSKFTAMFGWTPRSFEETLRTYGNA